MKKCTSTLFAVLMILVLPTSSKGQDYSGPFVPFQVIPSPETSPTGTGTTAPEAVEQDTTVLRYDDRGFGASTGNSAMATLPDLADDADAAVNYLSRWIIEHTRGR